MQDVQHISIAIARPPDAVYQFAGNPANLPQWAAGVAGAEIQQENDIWIAQAPFGKVKIRFAQQNALGVMDHDVELESGETFHNPMRVVPNGEGSELIFTLFRHPGMTDDEFAADKLAISNDLQTLKELLESAAG
ncbi:SRPBCC family protein [Alteromonas pelagimontana]|uniref:SRPBCC family protein n=1 Tax=Alteromonas pelagimontana TaxID=1858656 RepID=A0A6M4MGS0_9ALTE|nr:SRPBCC family protein [Alteromonas pelagimontana]QJR82391.1 SRPBCC family protein [Alteromonas pelagimontana]